MAISTSRKVTMTMLTLVLLGGTLVSWSPFMIARWQMHTFCSNQLMGTSLEQIEAAAAARDYEVLRLVDGTIRVHDARSLGRYICDLRFDEKGLSSATE